MKHGQFHSSLFLVSIIIYPFKDLHTLYNVWIDLTAILTADNMGKRPKLFHVDTFQSLSCLQWSQHPFCPGIHLSIPMAGQAIGRLRKNKLTRKKLDRQILSRRTGATFPLWLRYIRESWFYHRFLVMLPLGYFSQQQLFASHSSLLCFSLLSSSPLSSVPKFQSSGDKFHPKLLRDTTTPHSGPLPPAFGNLFSRGPIRYVHSCFQPSNPNLSGY